MSALPAFRPFALKRPCGDCPFRTDRAPFLDRNRVRQIADSLVADASFHCHKTLDYDNEDGTPEATSTSKHCAGALIILEHEENPNQMMRIGERLGLYDPSELWSGSPVFRSLAAWAAAHE